MRLLTALVLALALLSGCGDPPGTPQPSGSPEPELRFFGQVDRTGVRPQAAGSVRRIEAAGQLRRLAGPGAFLGGTFPALPTPAPGSERLAVLLSGCREEQPPRLEHRTGGWSARFARPATPVTCFAPEYYVAVWDVGGR